MSSFKFVKTPIYQETLTNITGIFNELERLNKNQKSLSSKATFVIEKIQNDCKELLDHLSHSLEVTTDEARKTTLEEVEKNLVGIVSNLYWLNSEIPLENWKNIEASLYTLKNHLSCFRDKQKRILILTANFGNGHMSAAQAIQEGLQETYGSSYHIEIADFSMILNAVIDKASRQIYDLQAKFIPSVYKFFFEGTDTKWQIKALNLINYPFAANKITKFFAEKNPDLVISTFPVWNYIASMIWKKHKKNAKFITIVTDSISIHHSWVTSDTDFHIVANQETALSLKKLGAEPVKIKILGFPVKLNFIHRMTREEKETFLKKHGLNPKNFTILFLATAETPRKAIKTMEQLMANEHNDNIIIITGRNNKICAKLEKIAEGHNNIKIFGWTHELPEFIKAADVVLTKAGGATVMECIAAEKPTIITQIIPGQEQGNAELIKQHQLGIVPKSANMTISESVEYIRDNYKTFNKNLKKNSNPESSLKIAKFIDEIMKTWCN